MEGQYFVYRHIRLDKNVPFYIGIGTKPKEYSAYWGEYKRAYDKSRRSNFWKNIIAKTGYRVEIIWEANDYEEVKVKEIEFIALYGRTCDGGTLVNHTLGGDGTLGILPTKEHRKKLVEVHTGNKYCLGQKQSEETRRRRSESLKGRIITEEHRDKISKANLGANPKKKTAARDRGKTVVDMQTGIFYDSLPEACEATNCNYEIERGRKQLNSKIARFIRAYGKEVTIDYASRREKVKEALRRKSKRLMLDLQTGVFFDNLPQACEYVNFNYSLAKIRLRNKSKKSRFVEIRL